MIEFRTTNKHTFSHPYGVNQPIEDYIYLKINDISHVGHTVIAGGYYYFKDENDNKIILRQIGRQVISKPQLHDLQGTLIPNLGSEKFFDLVDYLIEKLTIMTIQQEASQFPGANWGITGNGDIEVYVEQPVEIPEEE